MLYFLCIVILITCIVSLVFISKLKYWKSYACLTGKTAIIVGGSKGIGYMVALNLASRGCRVILSSRREDDSIKQKIIEETGNSNIVFKKLDLSSLSSIRKFAKEIIDHEKRLDLLINNAGIESVKSLKNTRDGLNPMMQVNYFGHFLLTHLLADLLKRSAPSRIIFVSSSLAFFHNLTLENLNQENPEARSTSDFKTFCNSKAAVVIMSDGFSEKLRLFRVTSNSVHPGILVNNKNLHLFTICQYENGVLYTLCKTVYNVMVLLFGKNAEQAAQPILKVALQKQFQTVTSRFVWDLNWYPKPRCARNREFCKMIWEESERLVKLHPTEKLTI